MQTFLAVLGVVYAAVFIWLTVRIVNRGHRRLSIRLSFAEGNAYHQQISRI